MLTPEEFKDKAAHLINSCKNVDTDSEYFSHRMQDSTLGNLLTNFLDYVRKNSPEALQETGLEQIPADHFGVKIATNIMAHRNPEYENPAVALFKATSFDPRKIQFLQGLSAEPISVIPLAELPNAAKHYGNIVKLLQHMQSEGYEAALPDKYRIGDEHEAVFLTDQQINPKAGLLAVAKFFEQRAQAVAMLAQELKTAAEENPKIGKIFDRSNQLS